MSVDWPEGWERTPTSDRSSGAKFRNNEGRMPTVQESIQEILHQLQLKDAHNIVVETDRPHRKDGMPYSQSSEPEDPGVVVKWEEAGQPYVLACDTYRSNKANLRAVALTLEAMRAIVRHGAINEQRAYEGLEALPPGGDAPAEPMGGGPMVHDAPPTTRSEALAVLDLSPDASPADIKKKGKRQLKQAHPDQGGSAKEFKLVKAAWDIVWEGETPR